MPKVKSNLPPHLYVDLCFTIVKENTTYSFIKRVIQHSGTIPQKILYIFYMSKFFSAWQMLMRPKNYNRTVLLIKLISGFKKKELEKLAHSYAEHALSFNGRQEIINMITDAKNRNENITILSASIDPVVKAFAHILTIDYRCSTLRYDNEVSTGELKFDMTGLKSSYVATSKHTTMVTDNFEDIEMQEKINDFYIVLNHPSHKKFWKTVSCVKGYIL